jgi:hypothetical protein
LPEIKCKDDSPAAYTKTIRRAKYIDAGVHDGRQREALESPVTNFDPPSPEGTAAMNKTTTARKHIDLESMTSVIKP